MAFAKLIGKGNRLKSHGRIDVVLYAEFLSSERGDAEQFR